MSKAKKYKKAFRIACELLNGSVIYGLGSFDCVHFDEVVEILDKLIAEGEGRE